MSGQGSADPGASLAASLPTDFKDRDRFALRLALVYGEAEAAQIIDALAAPGAQAFWINPLVPEEMHEEVLPPLVPLPGLTGVYVAPRESGLTRSAAAVSGAIYIQNPSSLLAVRVLDPRPGEEVLDLAAAPGGKTVAMAVAMNNQGRIAAVEVVPGRFHRLRANVARCGVTLVDFYQKDGRTVGRAVPERFDRVLIDAPCSSEARMRWSRPGSYAHWSLRKVRETRRKQKGLLMSGYAALKPGGCLVYCTCSFSPEENETVVAHLLKRTDAEVGRIEVLPDHVRPGLTEWLDKPLHHHLARTVRILPRDPWDGFYLAKIMKPG